MFNSSSAAKFDEEYRRLRRIATALISKILRAPENKRFDFIKAAKKLTIPMRNGTLIFDSEENMAELTDFFLFEFHAGGTRPVENFDAESAGLTDDEMDVLMAFRNAKSSLFKVEGLETERGRLIMRDLLDPDRPEILFTDLSMRGSIGKHGPVLLFNRIVQCQGFQTGTGCFFPFDPDNQDLLVRSYYNRMKTVQAADISQRRFIFFFQRHRELGLDRAYA